jgi:soluble P-type ATPase
MPLEINVPGRDSLTLKHLLLDQNGTLSDRGELLPEVEERIEALRDRLRVHVLSADTFGTLSQVASDLGVAGHRIRTGQEKLEFLLSLNPAACVAIGNGTNDEAMLRVAALGVAVLGPEGTSVRALLAADVVCGSIQEALGLLLEPKLLTATLRV